MTPNAHQYSAQYLVDAHWFAIRYGADIPKRADITAAALDDALEYLILLERPEVGPLRLRIGGMSICDMIGQDVRGLPFRALFTPECQTDLEALVTQSLIQPAFIDVPVAGETLNGQIVPGMMSLRPLRDGAGAVTRAIGTLIFRSDMSSITGVRLQLGEALLTDIADLEEATPHTPPMIQTAVLRGTETPALYAIEGGNTSLKTASNADARAHLRLVSST